MIIGLTVKDKMYIPAAVEKRLLEQTRGGWKKLVERVCDDKKSASICANELENGRERWLHEGARDSCWYTLAVIADIQNVEFQREDEAK